MCLTCHTQELTNNISIITQRHIITFKADERNYKTTAVVAPQQRLHQYGNTTK